ncbi:hypothetical protein ACEJ70_001158 [Acinetobacter baumannii]
MDTPSVGYQIRWRYLMLTDEIKKNAPKGAEFYVRRDGYYYRYDHYEELYYWQPDSQKWVEMRKALPEPHELELLN